MRRGAALPPDSALANRVGPWGEIRWTPDKLSRSGRTAGPNCRRGEVRLGAGAIALASAPPDGSTDRSPSPEQARPAASERAQEIEVLDVGVAIALDCWTLGNTESPT